MVIETGDHCCLPSPSQIRNGHYLFIGTCLDLILHHQHAGSFPCRSQHDSKLLIPMTIMYSSNLPLASTQSSPLQPPISLPRLHPPSPVRRFVAYRLIQKLTCRPIIIDMYRYGTEQDNFKKKKIHLIFVVFSSENLG